METTPLETNLDRGGADAKHAPDWALHVGVVLVVALIPRIIYLAQIHGWPFFYHPILDSRTQWKWGTILTQSYGIGNVEVTAKAPLYSYFLALCKWVSATDEVGLFTAHLLQLLTGVATCLLTYFLGRRVFSPRVGLVGALALALYSPGIYRDGQLLDTSLATFLAAAFSILFLKALDDPRSGRAWFKAGLVLGLLGVTRPNLLILGVLSAFLMLIWLWRQVGGRRTLAVIAILAAGTILPTAATVFRNYLVTGGFVLLSTTGGINLWTGNGPDADGYSPIPSGIEWERTWYVAMGAGRMNSRAQDAFWRDKSLHWILGRPGAAGRLFVKKLYLYWNAYEVPNNVSYDWGREHSWLLRVVPLTFAAIGPLGLVGMALGGWRSRRAALLALSIPAQMITVAVFFVAGRYRMPAVPALCIFAAFAVQELARLVGQRRYSALGVGVVVLAASVVLVNSDIYGVRRERGANRDWYLLGQSYLLAQDYQAAAHAFREAAKQHPDDADAFCLLGQTENWIGQPDASARDLRHALDLAPDYTMAAIQLSQLYVAQNWPLAEPAMLLRRAVDKQWRNANGLAWLVRLDVRLGRMEQAQSELDSLATLFGTLNQSDTRTADTAQAVMAAAMEAESAGLRVPASLRGGAAGP